MGASPQHKTRFRTESIELHDGWSGMVVTAAEGEFGARTLPQRPDWLGFLAELVTNAKRICEYAPLKVSQSVEVIRGRMVFGSESLDVVCKHTRTGARRRGFRAWRVSRERRSFDRAFELLGLGLETAMPLAVVERRRPRGGSWLITAFIADLVDLDQIVLSQLPRVEPLRLRGVKDAVASAVARLCVSIERSGLTYRDMKASNITFTNWDARRGPIRTILVDLDGLGRRSVFGRGRQWRALVRLGASLAEYDTVTRSDYVRFLKTYLRQVGQPPDSWKRRYTELARRVENYARRARRRKRGKIDGFSGG